MAILTISQLYELVSRHGVSGQLSRIMVAAALFESGGDTHRVGDAGRSIGLWQLHDGEGVGGALTVEQRQDPDINCVTILPDFRQWFDDGLLTKRLTGEDLAAYAYLNAEKPLDHDVPGSYADTEYRRVWRNTPDGPEAPPLALRAGQVARVANGPINLRAEATTAATALALVPKEARLYLIAGPVRGGGRDWWQVAILPPVGWVAGEFLAPEEAK